MNQAMNQNLYKFIKLPPLFSLLLTLEQPLLPSLEWLSTRCHYDGQ